MDTVVGKGQLNELTKLIERYRRYLAVLLGKEYMAKGSTHGTSTRAIAYRLSCAAAGP